MSDELKEIYWMAGCASIMASCAVIALIGYVRMKRSASSSDAD